MTTAATRRHERATKIQKSLGNRTTRTKKNVDHLRAKPPVLRLMRDRPHPPTVRDQTILDGGIRLGKFWINCKSQKRCAKPPYDRLLTNPVLRADYRTTQQHNRVSAADRTQKNVDHLRAQPPALRLMGDRTRPPKVMDPMELPGGGKLGRFWANCKERNGCVNSPYDRLLTNPVLRADYRYIN